MFAGDRLRSRRGGRWWPRGFDRGFGAACIGGAILIGWVKRERTLTIAATVRDLDSRWQMRAGRNRVGASCSDSDLALRHRQDVAQRLRPAACHACGCGGLDRGARGAALLHVVETRPVLTVTNTAG